MEIVKLVTDLALALLIIKYTQLAHKLEWSVVTTYIVAGVLIGMCMLELIAYIVR